MVSTLISDVVLDPSLDLRSGIEMIEDIVRFRGNLIEKMMNAQGNKDKGASPHLFVKSGGTGSK